MKPAALSPPLRLLCLARAITAPRPARRPGAFTRIAMLLRRLCHGA